MTISSNDRRHEYVGNGVATLFNGPRAFAAEHVLVFFAVAGVTRQVPDSQYTLSGVGTARTRVSFNDPPPLNTDILILRTVPYDQDTDITNQGKFLPELHENAFDRMVMQIQQLADGSMQLVLEDGEFVWDAQGNRIVRVGNPLGSQDAVNLQTLLAYLGEDGGAGPGVAPRLWDWIGDGTTTDFPIPGADIDDPLFYDSAMEITAASGNYRVLRPLDDFTVMVGDDPAESIIHFVSAPAADVQGFTVLRGFARPYTGPTPITTTAMRVVVIDTPEATLDHQHHNCLLVCTSPGNVTLTIRRNTGAAVDWGDGEYFAVLQYGVGKVSLVAEDGTLTVPDNFIAETRGRGSVISGTCRNATGGQWVAAGDLLRPVVQADLQVIAIADRSALISTNITTGTGKSTFHMPYGFLLQPVAERGIYASLAVAQSAGVVLIVDVLRNGVSILQNKLIFDNAEKTTVTSASPATFVSGGNVLYEDDEITVDVTQVGTAGARGLTVYLVGQRA